VVNILKLPQINLDRHYAASRKRSNLLDKRPRVLANCRIYSSRRIGKDFDLSSLHVHGYRIIGANAFSIAVNVSFVSEGFKHRIKHCPKYYKLHLKKLKFNAGYYDT
jgi:hypothetical protein